MKRFDWLPDDAVELEERRGAHAAHFRRSDGSYIAVFGKNLHYKDSDGKWRQRDACIKLRHDPGGKDTLYCVEDAHYKLIIKPDELSIYDSVTGHGIIIPLTGKPVVTANEIQTQIDGVPWSFAVTGSGIKSSLRVSSKKGKTTYRVPFQAIGGAVLAVTEYGDVIDIDGCFKIPKPVVYAADGRLLLASAWTMPERGVIAFVVDDSAFADGDLPYTIDPTTNFGPTLDGYVTAEDTYWPPTTPVDVNTSSTTITLYATLQYTGNNLYSVGILKFDTSSIPDNATITSATLQVNVSARSPYYYKVNGEWYDPGATIDLSDYAGVPGNTAFADASWSSLGIISTPLSNLSNINKSGFTGLRVGQHISDSVARTRLISINSSESGNPPLLIVTYTVVIDGSASVAAAAAASATGRRVALGSASVTGAAVVSAAATRRVFGQSSVTCRAVASGNGGFRVSAASSVFCKATTSASAVVAKPAGCSALVVTTVAGSGMRVLTSSVNAAAAAFTTALAQAVFVGAAKVMCRASASGTGINSVRSSASAVCVCSTSALGKLVAGTSANVVARATVPFAVGVTAFEERMNSEVVPVPTLPPPPSAIEELLWWAGALTLAVDAVARDLAVKAHGTIRSGPLAQRPEASRSFSFYWAIDDNNGNGRLYFDDGQWRPV